MADANLRAKGRSESISRTVKLLPVNYKIVLGQSRGSGRRIRAKIRLNRNIVKNLCRFDSCPLHIFNNQFHER